MTTNDTTPSGPRVLGPHDGDIGGPPGGSQDRFLLDGAEADGRVALVEHRLGPRVLAAPLHRNREDEYSFVVEGQVGALLGDDEVLAGPDTSSSSPAGSGTRSGTPATVPPASSRSSPQAAWNSCSERWQPWRTSPTPTPLPPWPPADIDLDRTMPIVERHRLVF